MGKGDTSLLMIPEDKAGEVARGTAILDCYTQNYLVRSGLELEHFPNSDDSYATLNVYVFGAIQLADVFGTEDFYNYYDEWVKEVIIPAFKIADKGGGCRVKPLDSFSLGDNILF